MTPALSKRRIELFNPASGVTSDFPQFSQLPAELRRMVWEQELSHERFLRVDLQTTTPTRRVNRIYNVVLEGLQTISKLFHVCSESRHLALDFYRVRVPCKYHHRSRTRNGTFYFNPELDTVAITGTEHLADFAHQLWSHDQQHVGLINVALNPNISNELWSLRDRLRGRPPSHVPFLKQVISRFERVIFMCDGGREGKFLGPTRARRTSALEHHGVHRSLPIMAAIPRFDRLLQDPRPLERLQKNIDFSSYRSQMGFQGWLHLLNAWGVQFNHQVDYHLMVTYEGCETKINSRDEALRWVRKENKLWKSAFRRKQRKEDEGEQAVAEEPEQSQALTSYSSFEIWADMHCPAQSPRFALNFGVRGMGGEIPIHTEILDRKIKFCNTGGDVLLFVKAPSKELAAKLVGKIQKRLDNVSKPIDKVVAGKRKDIRVGGGRYVDGITNPNDPVSLAEDILISAPEAYRGASFAFTQKFTFDWPRIATQGGDSEDETILRQALSFGNSGGHAGREKGLMFVAFCNEQPRFEHVLKHLLGPETDNPLDRLIDVVKAHSGGYWYVPAAKELGVPAVSNLDDVVEDSHWDVRSPNGYLFYNSQDYLHQMSQGHYVGKDPPNDRLLSLLGRTFSHWRDGWMDKRNFPRLPHLTKFYRKDEEKQIREEPVPVRKALTNLKTLTLSLSAPDSETARWNGLLRIEPKELIVGVIPDFTLGRGKEVIPYLSEEETLAAWLKGTLNEWSAMGHVVPDYERVVQQGLGKLHDDLQTKYDNASKAKDPKATFFRSALLSIQGVQGYLRNWKAIAEESASKTTDPEDKANMEDVSKRLGHLVDQPPRDFQDSVQLIFSVHCCLHLVGELTALGRLDQILWPFLEKDNISLDRAQEIVDCLWLKIGENAFVNRAFIYEYVSYGTTAVCGVGGNFPQGGGINQWVQQVTVGGYKATDGDVPEGGANKVTMLCLKASRRIPVNAPTLSLRVYKDMPDEYLDEAAKAILAGGAQPILYNDDKLCKGLLNSDRDLVSKAWSRNYAADGCYEPMFAGASEFTFNNVQPLLALEQTINQGATYGAAGPESLRGLKQTFRSLPAAKVKSFEQLQGIFLDQLEWLVIQCYNVMLENYGNLADICPSPLLSVLIDGCVEKGIDLTNGGARFHIMAPLCIGVSNTIDSLFAIQKLVYDADTAMTTLPELVDCLINDWGFNMIEPFQDRHLGAASAAQYGVRYQQLRAIALALPKWGSGDKEVNHLGDRLIEHLVKLCVDKIKSPALKPQLDRIAKAYGKELKFIITPGIGTFEGYVGDGAGCGASADGRHNGMPIASDLSPTPAAQDLPANSAFRNIYQAMKSYESEAVTCGLSNASPADMNIDEAFPLEDLKKFVKQYAQGSVGGNLITLTCANVKTYQEAVKDPEKYNLLRVRMGGWTEFYATMFPEHQEQHRRRQYFTP
ncbi:formate c-acetyltransferase [Fusarium albosuccineum]|uniref:Formate c-acetyltransferase n=1 Tax=Fusarium albosuccineum TaxID=1237068 RepID=A0A8H4P6S7_9HYPO|nr:formate c-acetyltransferase [Fusarium albosuccineum]